MFQYSYSQVIDSKQYNYVGNWYRWQGGSFITNLNIPKVTATTGRDTGAIRYALGDSSVYVWTGSQWRQLGGGSGGSVAWGDITGTLSNQTDLQNALNLKLNISTAAATYVPYTGAISSVNLGLWGLTTDRLIYNQTPTLAGGERILRWNDTDGTLDVGLKGGNVTLQIGQEQNFRAHNTTGASILNGQAVYISGSSGTNNLIAKAQANALLTSETTIGVLTEDIANGGHGFVTTFGLVRDINTSALTEGQSVYLSASSAGGLTSTEPTGSNYSILVGFCVRQHATNGVLFVNIDRRNIRSLNGLTVSTQTFVTGTTGTDFNISSSSSTHTFNLPTASATNRGALSTADWIRFNNSTNVDSSAARVRTGTYAQRVAIVSPANGDVFTQTDRLAGLYVYNQGSWRFQGDPLSYWFYNQMSRKTVSPVTPADGYNAPLTLTGAAAADFNTLQVAYSDNWLTALLKSTDVTITIPTYDSIEVDSVLLWLETEIVVDAVSNGTDDYGVTWGFDNSAGTYTSGDRIVFRYNHATAGGDWETRTVAAGSGVWTTKDTGIPFVAGSRMKLAMEINGYTRTIIFYINDVIAATHTSPDNVPFPNATTLATGISPCMFNFDRLAGSTNREFKINYVFGYYIKKNF